MIGEGLLLIYWKERLRTSPGESAFFPFFYCVCANEIQSKARSGVLFLSSFPLLSSCWRRHQRGVEGGGRSPVDALLTKTGVALGEEVDAKKVAAGMGYIEPVIQEVEQRSPSFSKDEIVLKFIAPAYFLEKMLQTQFENEIRT